MVAAPLADEVLNFFTSISEEAEEQGDGPLPVVWKQVAVACETSRRRRVGEVQLLLADLSWQHLVHFRRATASRAPPGTPLLAITFEDTAVRPVAGPAREAADEWVGEQLTDATFLEYATADEVQDDIPEEGVEEVPDEDTVAFLRARVQQLEAAQAAAKAPQPSLRGAKQTRPLLETDPSAGAALTAEDWQKLRAVAGSAPPRLAGHERAPRTTVADDLLAEEELEAAELQPAAPSDSPLLKLLSTQAQLLERLATPKQDAITAALGSGHGGDSGSGSSLGTRGIAARDAFLRIFENPTDLAEGIAKRAQQELGLSTQEPGMMRQYVERKVPMKNLKTVQIFSFFLAYQWEDCRRQGNQLGEAWAARGLVMAEQFAIDQGRTQLGFLLSGLPDIDTSHLSSRRTDVRPYGKLCAAPWMAAQVAFLKDVDYLENRMSSRTQRPTRATIRTTSPGQSGRQGSRRP